MIKLAPLLLLAASCLANTGSRYERTLKIQERVETDAINANGRTDGRSRIYSDVFSQKIDHNDPDSPAFNQRYWWDSTFYKPGGPIILHIGGESPARGSRIASGTDYELSKRHNGVICLLEHRYYGESVPVPDFSADNLAYLSSSQAIADLVAFVAAVRAQDGRVSFNSTGSDIRTANVVLVGGSYAGNLAAWARELHPDIFFAAYASSAPVLFREDFFEYAVAVDNGIPRVQGGSQRCVDGWKKAILQLDELLTSGDAGAIAAFKEAVGLTMVHDAADLAAWVSEIPAGSIQYGPSYERLLEYNGVTVIEGMCGMFQISDPTATPEARFSEFTGLVKAFAKKLSPLEKEKINTSFYAHHLASPGRLWWWQVCTEFGYWQITEPKEYGLSIYTRLNTVEWNRGNCAKLFGKENAVPRVSEVLQYYGNGTFQQDKIVWVNGEIDPWRYLGFTDTANSTAGQPVILQPAFHCSDLYNGRIKGTGPAVKKIYKAFSKWL